MRALLFTLLLAITSFAQTGTGRMLLADDAAATPDAAAETPAEPAEPAAATDDIAQAADAGDAAETAGATDAAAETPAQPAEGAEQAEPAAAAANTGEQKDVVATNAGEGTSAEELFAPGAVKNPEENDEEDDDSSVKEAEKSGYKEDTKDSEAQKSMQRKMKKAKKALDEAELKHKAAHQKYWALRGQKKAFQGMVNKKAAEFMTNVEAKQKAKTSTVKEELKTCYVNLNKVAQEAERHYHSLFDGIQMQPTDRDEDKDDESELSLSHFDKLVGTSANPAEGGNGLFYGALATVLVSGAAAWKIYSDRQKYRTYDSGLLEF